MLEILHQAFVELHKQGGKPLTKRRRLTAGWHVSGL